MTISTGEMVHLVVEEIFNRGDVEMADALFAKDYVNHGGLITDLVQGPEAIKLSVALYRSAFPAFQIAVDGLTSEDGAIILRWVAHNGSPFVDEPPATSCVLKGITRCRVENGKIAESWTVWDNRSALVKLSAMAASRGGDQATELGGAGSQEREPRMTNDRDNEAAEHALLNVFLGKWNTEGEQHAGPFGPDATFSAVETYERLTGDLFMVHRLDGRFGDNKAASIEIIGHDASDHSYPTHTYYDDGTTNEWRSREDAGTWTLTGDSQVEGKSLKVRCTTVFSDAGNTRTGKWEYSSDGSKWASFMDARATRA